MAIRFLQVALLSVTMLLAACGKTENQPQVASDAPPAVVEKEDDKPVVKTPDGSETPTSDPVLDGKVSAHLGYLNSVEGEATGYRASIDENMQKEMPLDKEIESLQALQKQLADTTAAMEPMVLEMSFFESEKVRRQISAELLYACGQQLVQKLRILRNELNAADHVANPSTAPDPLDDILKVDPVKARENRKNDFLSHLMMAEEAYIDISDLIEKQKLQKKLYFASSKDQDKALTSKELQKKSEADSMLSPQFFIHHELEMNLSAEFLKSIVVPRFMKKSPEAMETGNRIKLLKGNINGLKKTLKIEKSLSDVSSLMDLID